MTAEYLRTNAKLSRLVSSFEAASLSKEEWNHSAHLAVATYYLLRYGGSETLELLRMGIGRLNEFHGVENSATSGYHETLTRFWLAVIVRYLQDHRSTYGSEPITQVRAVVEEFGDQRNLARDYWSFDVASNREARRSWVAPDIRSLDALS